MTLDASQKIHFLGTLVIPAYLCHEISPSAMRYPLSVKSFMLFNTFILQFQMGLTAFFCRFQAKVNKISQKNAFSSFSSFSVYLATKYPICDELCLSEKRVFCSLIL